MAGSPLIWEAVLNQARIFRTLDSEDTIDHVLIFKHLMMRPVGPRIGVISGTGGHIITTVDFCEASGLMIPELSLETKKKYRAFLSPYGTSCQNPVDVSIAAATDSGLYTRAIQVMDQSDEVDVIICIHTGDQRGDILARGIVEQNLGGNKPLVVILLGSTEKNARAIRILLDAGIPAFGNQRNAIRAIAAVTQWKEWRG
jgi:acyl-CoA synthetase (NDP forming)